MGLEVEITHPLVDRRLQDLVEEPNRGRLQRIGAGPERDYLLRADIERPLQEPSCFSITRDCGTGGKHPSSPRRSKEE